MIQPIRGLLICIFLLGSIVGCNQTPPKATNPESPQATDSQSTVMPEAGWKIIEGEGVTLSLPPEYEGGNPSKDLDEIGKKLKAIDPEYENRIEAIRQNPAAIAFLAFDAQNTQSGFLTNVNIATETVIEEVTVEQYLDAATGELSAMYQIEDQKVVSVDQYPAGRIVAEIEAGETRIKQLFYTIQDGDTFWIVTYATTADEFDQRLPSFEKSIQSFRVQS